MRGANTFFGYLQICSSSASVMSEKTLRSTLLSHTLQLTSNGLQDVTHIEAQARATGPQRLLQLKTRQIHSHKRGRFSRTQWIGDRSCEDALFQ